MAQISLYIDDAMAARLSSAAKARQISVSKYVSKVVSESLYNEEADELKKKQILKKLQGALNDDTFNEPSEMPMVAEALRRYDLL